MVRFGLLAFCALLVACGPQYRTKTSLIPPESIEGRTCVATCEATQELCRSRVDADQQRCESDAERTADRKRQQCETRVSRQLATCLAQQGSAEGVAACQGEFGPDSKRYRRCDRASPKWCRADYNSCTANFEACYTRCGGEVRKRKVCVLNCK